MKKIIFGFLASIGFLTIVLIVGIYFSFKSLFSFLEQEETTSLTEFSVLNINVGSVPFIDVTQRTNLFSVFQPHKAPSLLDTVLSIKHAAKDDRIKAIFLSIEGDDISLSEAQELKEALELFKQSKKPIYAFSYSFGENGNGTSTYYLALSADKIFLQPQGMLSINGYAIENYFFRDLLDKFKIIPQLDRREGYKGVIEPYTNNSFSPETKQNLQTLLDEMLDQVQNAISAKLSLPESQVKSLIDKAPYLDITASQEKLITGLLHKEEAKTLIEEELQQKANFISLKTYKKSITTSPASHKVALISVQGEIGSPASIKSYQDKDSPSQVAQKLRRAGKDKEIDAIILRVNSPGGTVTGAETIWYEVDYIANTIKKPIIISMGTLAASAGYQIAAPATKVVANPGTITGSIGVASGKVSIGKALAEYGINIQQLVTAKNAGMWSNSEEFSPDEWAKMQQNLDHIYDLFLKKVSEGRNLSVEEVRKIAKGQVWTGVKAKELGLVDELGGFLKAIDITKQLINVPEETPINIIVEDDHRLGSDLLLNFFESMQLLNNLTQNIKTIWGENTQIQSKLDFQIR